MMMTQYDPLWTPDRLLSYPLITDLDLSADGRQIVYCLREPLLTDDESRFINHLYRVAVDGGEPVRLTYRGNNIMPRWSPDGRFIAFAGDREDDGKTNLYVMRADGGAPWPVVRSEKGILGLAWSPDGGRIAFTMVAPDDEARQAAKKAKNDPIRWGIDHERAQLWVTPFDPAGGASFNPTPVTPPDRHVTSFEWTDDGESLAFVHQPTPVVDDWPVTRLALVSTTAAENGEFPIRDLAPLPTMNATTLQPFGDRIAAVRADEPVNWMMVNRVVLYPVDGGDPRPLATTPDAQPFLLNWSADGRDIYVLEFSGTSSAIYALPVNGDAPRLVYTTGQEFLSLVKAQRSDLFAFVAQSTARPNCVATLAAGSAAWHEVTTPPMPPDWPEQSLPETHIVRWTAPDGREIEGLLTLPLNYSPGRACPTLVVVHGGPAGLHAQSYVARPELYPIASFAERGYAVLRPNPRGSSGYGAEFRTANRRDWGGGDYDDIMSGVDYLIEQGIADPDRLGIMGWSHGGYMTSWTITQTRRFRAASVGAGVTNLVSMNGTCDIPSFIPDYFCAEFWDDLEVYIARSAVFQVKGVTTPTLIQHGDHDDRVPLSQGKELYNALKRQGVPVEMDIYPRQPHGPNEPRLFADIMRRNLEWFDRWIPDQDVD
jgi:dipeptidyl aminopeptidase/acylaminoacyl peptidase